MNLFSLKNLSLHYGEKNKITALNNINLNIQKGDFFVLMGPSGSGKSTLLRTLNGLKKLTEGDITLHLDHKNYHYSQCDDSDFRTIRTQHLSMVFQHFGLFPWKTVGQNIAYGLEVQKRPRDIIKNKIHEILDLINLKKWIDKYPHELSGGMQQRVGLARALVTDTKIILMDEPFSALDPLIREDLQNELLSLQKQLHKTIIFVTHDLHEGLKLANRMVLLKEGKVKFHGTPEDLYTKYQIKKIQLKQSPTIFSDHDNDYLGQMQLNSTLKQILT